MRSPPVITHTITFAGQFTRHFQRHCFFSLVFVLVVLLAWPGVGQISGTSLHKNVLVLYDEQDKLPGLAVFDQSLRSTLTSASTAKIEIYSENLDRSRFDEAGHYQFLRDYFRQKYGRKKIDVIISVMGPSLDFLLAQGGEIFPGTPIVFCGVDRREIESRNLSPNVTGVLVKREFKGTLDLALRLQPETKNVVFIAGTSSFDKRLAEQAIGELRQYENRLAIQYITDFEFNELLMQVSQLPPKTIILSSTVFSDNTGNAFVPHDVVSLISQKANAPVYGFLDQFLGRGIVGGHLYSIEAHGKKAAELALRVLEGQEIADIPIVEGDVNLDMFDWREMQKWGIGEDKLPPGSIIRFKEPTFWEQYRWLTVGVVTIGVFQTLLILWLLFLRERRKQAQRESLQFASLARAEHKKLDEVVSNVPGIVWESWLEPGTNLRKTRFVSDYAEEMLGYPVENWLSTPAFLLTIVLDEDRERVAKETEEIFEGGKGGVLQFRWVAKDGRVLWAEAHLAVICDERGNPVGLRGVTMDVTERKRAEEKLRVSELELIEAQRLSQIGSWEWDPKTDTVTWTEELYRIAGLDPSLPALNWEQHPALYTPESFERLASAVATAIKSGTPYVLELELIRSDQQHRWVSARGEVLRDDDSKIIKLRGTLQDITDRKEAEEALSESEARYRNVVETQTELICRYLPDTTLTFVNDAYCRYFGKTREELIGAKFVNFIPVHARDGALSHIESLVENPRTEAYEHEVIQPNGARGWQQWIDHLVETSNGHPRELQGIGRDITDKHRAEEELRASENRFRTMADNAPLLIWMCGPDKLCNYVNQGWLDFTGRSIDMELGSGWTVGIHDEDQDRTSEIFDSAFDRREPFKLEYRLRAADGTFHWVYDSGTPRFSSEGEFLGYIGSCVDISDRKASEEALKKALDEVSQLQKQLHQENIYLKEEIKREHNFDEIIGYSDALKYVLFKIEQVAPTDATVLITGETGTGKELVARAIHSASLRKDRPLVKVNCAALSATLIESELFGHERGSFTGASARKIGRFELANDATIFLDEIGELPPELQAKLLRVIQEGEFERLGSSKTIKVDVRIIAATNRNLNTEVKNGRFREDLLFRLNVFPITVPPLRERKADIPELTKYFVNRFAKKLGKTISAVSPTTLRTLSEYSWPGNIRELANVIERSVINTNGDVLRVAETLEVAKAENGHSSSREPLEVIERNYIIQILDGTDWKVEGTNGAARILGLNPSTLRTRMTKLGISKKSMRS